MQTAAVPRWTWLAPTLPLALIRVAFLPAEEAHRFVVLDVLRTVHDGDHLALGADGLPAFDVRGDFREVALRRIPIAPNLDPNLVVGHDPLLRLNVYIIQPAARTTARGRPGRAS